MALVTEQRGGRPLVIIDIAVPRDIEPSVRELAGVTLYDMDDLQREVARSMSGREAEVERAMTILGEEAHRFDAWLASLDVVPTVAALRIRGEEIVQRVLADNEQRWESLSPADRERLEAMARAIVTRLLHEPTVRLKRAADKEDSYVHVQALRELFGLEPEALEAPYPPAGADVASLEERRRRPRSA
jgi:glutamyl-tRNA reductase